LERISGMISLEGALHEGRIEEVDAHVREVVLAARAAIGLKLLGDAEFVDILGGSGLFHEVHDPTVLVYRHDAEGVRRLPVHRGAGDGHAAAGFHVLAIHLRQIHPVELVARDDEVVGGGLGPEMDEVLPNRVGRPLVPARMPEGLLGGEDLDVAAGEYVEFVGARDVEVEGRGIELGEYVYLVEAGVYAVGNGYVDYPILPAEGYRRLGPILCERKQAGALAAAEHDGKNLGHGILLPAAPFTKRPRWRITV
jgi:hypothetical protein